MTTAARLKQRLSDKSVPRATSLANRKGRADYVCGSPFVFGASGLE